MNYTQTIDYLFALQKFGIKFGLSSTENLLNGLGNPHVGMPCLHLAGTNGKGSTGAAILSILHHGGYKVGFFTSPHLISFRERFVIGREMIGEEDVIRLTRIIRDVCSPEEPPTFFEFVTVMAFQYFTEQKVDLAIMETGMGGRLDSTNICESVVGVITNISLEHKDYLGNTLEKIAYEKAGIIKPGLDVVTGEPRKHLRALFERTTEAKGGHLYSLGRDFKVRSLPGGGFNYYGIKLNLKGLRVNLGGRHQIRNAGTALAAVELLGEKGWPVDEVNIRDGLEDIQWPARGQILREGPDRPRIMLDGAHNPAAAKILAQLIRDTEYGRLYLVLGIMSDKNIGGVMNPLVHLADELILTRAAYSRAAEPEVLVSAARDFSGPISQFSNIPDAVTWALDRATADDLVLVTGSLFTVGEAMEFLQQTK